MFDWNNMSPQARAMLSLGGHLGAASAPTRMPVGLGGRIGPAMLGFGQDMDQQMNMQMQRKMRQQQMDAAEEQLKEMKRVQKIRDMAMGIIAGEKKATEKYADVGLGGQSQSQAGLGGFRSPQDYQQMMGELMSIGAPEDVLNMAKSQYEMAYPKPPAGMQYNTQSGAMEPIEAYWEQREKIAPRTEVNVGDGFPKWVPSGFMPNDPQDPNQGVRPITGGPQDPSQKQSSDALKEYKKGVTKLGQVRQSLENYRSEIQQKGVKIIPGKGKARMSASYRDLLLEMKELYNLGVLNGPDLMIMEQVLKDPTSIVTGMEALLSDATDKEILQTQLDMVTQKLDAAQNRLDEVYGSGGSGLVNQNAIPETPTSGTINRNITVDY